MRAAIAILVMILSTRGSLRAQPLSHEESVRLQQEANLFFRQGHESAKRSSEEAADLYNKALLRFERLVRDGDVSNERVFYNVGNIYFYLGDLGRAILNYRRALLYAAGDANLQQNLEYARSRRIDRIEERQERRALKMLLFWHYDLPFGMRAWIFAVLFVLFWIGAAVRIFRRDVMPGWSLCLTAALTICLGMSLAHDAFLRGEVREGVVLAEQVIARKGDGESYEPAFREPLHAGAEFRLVEKRAGWLLIELRDGRTCWLPEGTAELV